METPKIQLPKKYTHKPRLDKVKPVSVVAYLNGWADRSLHIFEEGLCWGDIRRLVNAKAKSKSVNWPNGSRVQVYVNQDGLRHNFWMEVVR
jgi:hypothetical protein